MSGRGLTDHLDGMLRLAAWYAQDGANDAVIISIGLHWRLVALAKAASLVADAKADRAAKGKVMFDTQHGYAEWLRAGDRVVDSEKQYSEALGALGAYLQEERS
jgi:hypothetical protein